MHKYGLDAPKVTIYLLVAGIFMIFLMALINIWSGLSAKYIMYINIFMGISIFLYLITALLMVLSSYIGKTKLINKVVKRPDIVSAERILDVGCGSGVFLTKVSNKIKDHSKVIGIDIWNSSDQSANHKVKTLNNIKNDGCSSKCEVLTADMRSLPFEDNYFDLVFSCLAIHNLRTTVEIDKALTEIARVIKPGGKIILIDFMYLTHYRRKLSEMGFGRISHKYNAYIFPLSFVLEGSYKN